MLSKWMPFFTVAFLVAFSASANATPEFDACISRVHACNDQCDRISSSDYLSLASCAQRCSRLLKRCRALLPSKSNANIRGFLGINMSPARGGGVFVSSVFSGTAAEVAGVLPGDVIWLVDGYVLDVPSFQQYIGSKPGQIVLLTIIRSGRVIEGLVQIGAIANE